MRPNYYSLLLFISLFFVAGNVWAQTNSDAKAKQLEEMRKLKQQMMEEQKTIQQQNEWNSQSSQQEIKKLNQENQQSKMEIAVTKQDAAKAKADVLKARAELESKQYELARTQAMIDSAKARLASTEGLLMQSEMIRKRTEEELLHQEDSVKMLKQEQALQDLKLTNQTIELNAARQRNKLYIIAAALGIGLFLVVAALLAYRQKTIKELNDKNKIIQEEKRRSDELLLNILPEEVMHELKAHGKTTARNYAKATVLFADIKDFTVISEQLSPDDLIEGLDAYFERFDKVIEKYDIEKIKTIGDAYVCAGGIPTKSEGNPHLVVQAALDFMYEIDKLRRERLAQGKIPFEFRIGIHTGQLVAGVIGIRKFAYDIWGDTVNMAARMQQSSDAGKINISGATYELVKDKFACIYRGKIEAKNKGEIDMYFVEKAIV
jgi:class 3 adenylate cyclase